MIGMEQDMNIKDAVIDVITLKTGEDLSDIKDDSNLIDDLHLNDIDLVDLFMEIENKVGISLSDDDIHRLVTVKDIADYIECQRN